MDKILLPSILVATVAIPVLAARDPDGVRGLKRALLYTGLFEVAYWLVAIFLPTRA